MSSSPIVRAIQSELAALADAQIADDSQRFFKTGPGEYGAGDRFRGIRVPVLRAVARRYRSIAVAEAQALLHSPWHEDRMTALLIWVDQFNRGDLMVRSDIYERYLANTEQVNNWDLVDASAHHIVGPHLQKRDRSVLEELAASSLVWDRRIAIIATLHYIRQGDFEDTLNIAHLLVHDAHDLIHKAVGWMLREVGKRSMEAEEAFLRVHYQQMPRTMLRYAIEKFPEELRQAYLKGEIEPRA